jgi:hypothetical protein
MKKSKFSKEQIALLLYQASLNYSRIEAALRCEARGVKPYS